MLFNSFARIKTGIVSPKSGNIEISLSVNGISAAAARICASSIVKRQIIPN
ncbi:hypothetical protein [Clostridium lacusfryxellense]|uniref:hypothetical protein n=1 Tax=Clostridium lacusfryxellense TaxID=205328 RepID=UPI001FE7719D|nr:hypothetical protein [Clostridium lacusfryxellense]